MKNNIVLKEEHYLQTHGTAMGTQMSLAYANIFMGRLGKELLEKVFEAHCLVKVHRRCLYHLATRAGVLQTILR